MNEVWSVRRGYGGYCLLRVTTTLRFENSSGVIRPDVMHAIHICLYINNVNLISSDLK